MLIKINCQCGTRYSFEVEPVHGRMPHTVACPNCSADGTEAANQLIAYSLAAQPAASEAPSAAAPASPLTPAVPAAAKPRLRVSGGSPNTGAPSHAAAAAPASVAAEMCHRHIDQPATEHCYVCKKPICPECMSMFGYLCSVNCRYQAEQQGIVVPKYKFQKRSVEAREFRKGALITGVVVAVVFALIASWYWYDFASTSPKVAYTIKLGSERDVYSQFLGENKLLLVSRDEAKLHDIKADKDDWTTNIKDAPRPKPAPKPVADETVVAPQVAKSATQLARNVAGALRGRTTKPAAPVRQPAKPAPQPAADPTDDTASSASSDMSDDESDSFSFSDFSYFGRPRIFVDSENIWISTSTSLKSLDQKTGQIKTTFPYDGPLVSITAEENHLLVITAPKSTLRSVKRIEVPSGTVTGLEVPVPLSIKKTLKKGELPTSVLPTARVLLHQELADRKEYRPQVIQTSSEFFSGGDSVVEMRVRLVEIKQTAIQTMKARGPSVVNGELKASSNVRAVASEILNDMKRADSGGFRNLDESTYAVALRRFTSKDPIVWTNTVSGVPLFFSFKTVDVLVANKHLIALDKQNKKLFEATLSYGLSEDYIDRDSSTRPPGVELDNVLYFFDQGVLTAFELPSGSVRWRLPSIGISCIQTDAKGMLYINTSTAAPESIQYSDQITFDNVDPVLLKVDPVTGKTLWKTPKCGLQTFFSGKYLYGTSTTMGGLGLGIAVREAFGMPAASGPTYFHLYRIDPSNGAILFDYSKNKDGSPSQVDFQNNKIALNFGDQVRIMKFLQLF